MSILKLATAGCVAAALGLGVVPAARAETTSNGCVISGPAQVNVYRQAMDFSVVVTPPSGLERDTLATSVALTTPAGHATNTISITHGQLGDRGVFPFDAARGAHDGLTYGTMHEVVDGIGDPSCGGGARPITVRSATRPYISLSRTGDTTRINGTIEHYNKDFTVDGANFGRWDRIRATNLDFQRFEGGRWVTKVTVPTDSRGNASMVWVSSRTGSSWRVQYRGGWWLQATATAALVN